MNSRKAQTSVYVIVGIVLVIIIGIVFFSMNSQKTDQLSQEAQELRFGSGDHEVVNDYVERCMKDSLVEGILEYGLPATGANSLRNFVTQKTIECIDGYDSFTNEYEITFTAPTSNLEMTEEGTIVYTYKQNLEMVTEGERLEFEEFRFDFERTVYSNDFSNGVAEKDITLESVDRKSSLFVPKGTKVTDAQGNPLNYISLKVLDKKNNGMRNSFVIGNLIYEGLPDGAQFEAPDGESVIFKLNYDDEDLENVLWDGEPEESLKCTYFEDVWKTWPTTVDTEKNVLECQIKHFTGQAGSSCGYEDIETAVVRVYKEVCGYSGPDLDDKCTEFVYCADAQNCNDDEEHGAGKSVFMEYFDPEMDGPMPNSDDKPIPVVGYTSYDSVACGLNDWVHPDKEENTCDCTVIDDANPDGRPCAGTESNRCIESCTTKAVTEAEIIVDGQSVKVINNGPVKTDGIADGEGNCKCVLDERNLPEDPERPFVCEEVVPAPLTWGWKSYEEVGGSGTYKFTVESKGDNCVQDVDEARGGIAFAFEDEIKVPSYGMFADFTDEKEYKNQGFYKDLVRPSGFDRFSMVSPAKDEWYEAIGNAFNDEGVYSSKEKFISFSNSLIEGEHSIVVDVKNSMEDAPGCAYASMRIEISAKGLTLLSNQQDGECSVSIDARKLYERGCDEESTESTPVTQCLDKVMNANGLTPDTMLCDIQELDPCMENVEPNGGYCDHANGNMNCLFDKDLSGVEYPAEVEGCYCGGSEEDDLILEGTTALCCGGDIVTSVAEGLPFECSSRTGVVNTCMAGATDEVVRLCSDSCPVGYDTVSDGDCPVYGIDGKVTSTQQCCETVSSCEIGTGEILQPGEFKLYPDRSCDYCTFEYKLLELESNDARLDEYCHGKIDAPCINLEQCDGGLKCCIPSDGTEMICTYETDCQEGSIATCGNGEEDEGEECEISGSEFFVEKTCSNGLRSNTIGFTCMDDCMVNFDQTCTCGDGDPNNMFAKKDDGEECDAGSNNGIKETCPYGESCETYCTTNCRIATNKGGSCPDGVVNGDEVCEPNIAGSCTNELGYKGIQGCESDCSAVIDSCEITEFCGDEKANGPETCDQESYAPSSSAWKPLAERSCRGDCSFCGDGIVNGNEVCDSDPTVDLSCPYGDYEGVNQCKPDCSGFTICETTESCGDGIVNGEEDCETTDPQTASVTCEEGGYPGTSWCQYDCAYGSCIVDEGCGDGEVNGVEVCDIKDESTKEKDCPAANGYAGKAKCNSECSDYETTCVATEFCGDGEVNGNEKCDNSWLTSSEDCTTIEGYKGNSECNSECSDYGTCVPTEFCGDQIVNGDEICEHYTYKSCSDLGKPLSGVGGGDASCNSDCGGYNTDICTCGDGAINGQGEVCDGSNFGGKTCNDYGKPMDGELTCSQGCTYIDSSTCSVPDCIDEYGEGVAENTCQCGFWGGQIAQGDYCCINLVGVKYKKSWESSGC